MPIKEFYLDRVLRELDLTQEQFIDLCILLGCDYCDSIRGIGPKRAMELIRQHKNIEGVVKSLDTKKYPIPENWPFEEARRLFKEPEVQDPEGIELKWSEPDVEELVKFMVNDKGFSEERIRNGAKKLEKSRTTVTQGRLDTFFKVVSVTSTAAKRKEPTSKGPDKKKQKTTGGSSCRRPK